MTAKPRKPLIEYISRVVMWVGWFLVICVFIYAAISLIIAIVFTTLQSAT